MGVFDITIPNTGGIFGVFDFANTWSNGIYGIGITIIMFAVIFSMGLIRGFKTKNVLIFASFSSFAVSTILWAVNWISHKFVILYLFLLAFSIAIPKE